MKEVIYERQEVNRLEKKYYFSFDEPIIYSKKIVCTFYVSNIEGKKAYFFITNENNQVSLYYSMMNSSVLINFVREYMIRVNLDRDTTFTDIFEIPDFKKEYNKMFLKCKILNDQNYIIETIERMSKDNIYNANNKIQGLDGFSIQLKLDKESEYFYSWCIADDKKYFYVLDFINYILSEVGIDEKYRIKKVGYI